MKKTAHDELLKDYFRLPIESDRANNLEQDVWYRIHKLSGDIAQSWFVKVLIVLSMPRFQIVSISIAVIIGLGLSPVIPFNPTELPSVSEASGLNIFATQAPYLLTTQLMGS